MRLAHDAVGLSEPNPRVGCVILAPDGRELGTGHTQAAGGPHAEVMALRDAAARGASVAGATAVVTLEPCSHQGRTPPCCDALIWAGLKQVVVAVEDPNPLVAGAGIARLKAAGIEVVMAPQDWADQSRELNIGFFSRMQRGLPFVRMKMAASLDGRTALPNGHSQWITGEAARVDGHHWRRRAGAVLSGIGTVRADDPRMDVRHVPTARQPLRVIVDSTLQISAQAKVLEPPGEALIVSAVPTRSRADLSTVECLHLPGPSGQVDLRALLQALAHRGVNELHVEAGETLNGALLDAGLVDELLIYQAPVLLGAGRGMAGLAAVQQLDAVTRWRRIECTAIEPDLRLRFRRL